MFKQFNGKINYATPKPYTFAIRTCQRLSKNCKRVCLANAPEEMKIVANLKDKMTEMKESQPLTKVIKNRRDSSSVKICSPFELHRKLKNYPSKSPTFS